MPRVDLMAASQYLSERSKLVTLSLILDRRDRTDRSKSPRNWTICVEIHRISVRCIWHMGLNTPEGQHQTQILLCPAGAQSLRTNRAYLHNVDLYHFDKFAVVPICLHAGSTIRTWRHASAWRGHVLGEGPPAVLWSRARDVKARTRSSAHFYTWGQQVSPFGRQIKGFSGGKLHILKIMIISVCSCWLIFYVIRRCENNCLL